MNEEKSEDCSSKEPQSIETSRQRVLKRLYAKRDSPLNIGPLQKISGMGRRRFLQTLAGLGVSGAALNHMTKDAFAELTGNSEDEVPRLEALVHTNHDEVERGAQPERKPIYYTISREKWAIVESAHDAREKIEKRLTEQMDLDPGVMVRTITSGQHQQKAVVAEYPIIEKSSGETITPDISYEDFSDMIPAKTDGIAGRGTEQATKIENIPVLVERQPVKQLYYSAQYRPVPGGCAFDPDPDNATGTIGTPAYDRKHDREALLTAKHVIDGSSYEYIHQPDSTCDGSYIGNADRYKRFSGFDAGVINPSRNTEYDLALYGSGCNDSGGYRNRDVAGKIASSTLRDNEGNEDYKLTKQGKSSGQTSGYITNVSDNAFRTTAGIQSGDSGGPFYKNYSGDLTLIAGIAYASQSGDSKATQMDVIEDELRVRV